MNRHLCAALLLCGLFGAGLHAQYTSGTIANNFFGIDTTGAADAQSYTTANFSAPDDGSLTIPLPFSFPFFGNNYTTVYLSTNGLLSFTNSNLGATPKVSQTNPDADAALPANAIYFAWNDGLAVTGIPTSGVLTGSLSATSFGIQCIAFQQKPNNEFWNCTVVLHTNGVIEVHPQQGGGTSYGPFYIGIENATSSTGVNKPGGFSTGTGLNNSQAYAFYPPGTAPAGGGGDGGDESCSTGEHRHGWLLLVALAGALALAARRSRPARI